MTNLRRAIAVHFSKQNQTTAAYVPSQVEAHREIKREREREKRKEVAGSFLIIRLLPFPLPPRWLPSTGPPTPSMFNDCVNVGAIIGDGRRGQATESTQKTHSADPFMVCLVFFVFCFFFVFWRSLCVCVCVSVCASFAFEKQKRLAR